VKLPAWSYGKDNTFQLRVKVVKVRIKYEKGDKVRFLSHLDVARVIQMTLRRAGWPIKISKGFSPKPKVSFYAPLPVGTSGGQEYFDVALDDERVGQILLEDLVREFSRKLPDGFCLKEAFLIPDSEDTLEKKIWASEYLVEIEEVNRKELVRALDAFLEEKSVLFRLRRPKKTVTLNLRPYVLRAQVLSQEKKNKDKKDNVRLNFLIRHEDGRTVRPQWVLASLSRFGVKIDWREAIVERVKIYVGGRARG